MVKGRRLERIWEVEDEIIKFWDLSTSTKESSFTYRTTRFSTTRRLRGHLEVAFKDLDDQTQVGSNQKQDDESYFDGIPLAGVQITFTFRQHNGNLGRVLRVGKIHPRTWVASATNGEIG